MISVKKHVDRGGGVSWHMERGNHRVIVRFTARQYREDRAAVARSLVRNRNQLKVVPPVQRLSEKEVLKMFGRES